MNISQFRSIAAQIVFLLVPFVSAFMFNVIPSVNAETIYLKNGKVIDGEIVLKNNGKSGQPSYLIDVQGVGEVTFEQEEIEKIDQDESEANPPRFVKIMLKNGSEIKGELTKEIKRDLKTQYVVNIDGVSMTYDSMEISQLIAINEGSLLHEKDALNFDSSDLIGDYGRYSEFIKKINRDMKQWSDSFKDESILFRQNIQSGQLEIEQPEICRKTADGLKKYMSKVDTHVEKLLNVKLNPEFRTYHRRLVLSYQEMKILLTDLDKEIEDKLQNQEATCQIDSGQFSKSYEKDISELDTLVSESETELEVKVNQIIEQRRRKLREDISGLRGLSSITVELQYRVSVIINYEKNVELAQTIEDQQYWSERLEVEKNHLKLYLSSMDRVRQMRAGLADILLAPGDAPLRDKALMALRHLTYALDDIKAERYDQAISEVEQYRSIAAFFA